MQIDLGYLESSHTIPRFPVTGPGNPLPDLLALARANDWVVLDNLSTAFISPPPTLELSLESCGPLWKQFQDRARASELPAGDLPSCG